MFELKVKNNNGEVVNLSTSEDYTVYKITGLEPPKVNFSSSTNATSDGITITNRKVEKRNIVIYMTINGDVETNRNKLYRYFPLKKDITIYFKNGVKNVSITGSVEVIECDLFSNRQVAQVSIICPQPYFKSVDDLVSNFSAVASLLEFPVSFNSSGNEVSAIITTALKTIVNAGEVESGAIIRLLAKGDVVNPTIYNVFENKQLSLNVSMVNNDEIIINTYLGQKSITLIRNGIASNGLGYLLPNSSWLTLSAGDNVFTYECESGDTNLQIEFITSKLYGGV